MGMTYAVPFDYKQSEVRVDAIVSHTVLEHISPHVIEELVRDFRRVLNPGGMILHGIDHSDHRANVDTRLSRIDFLRYSDKIWNLLCIDPQDYTNRLRHSDYVAIFRAAGFEIVFERALRDPTCREALSDFPLAARDD
jgi:cyclopropane fatty-acyl-phospholipid synthase-like methyltransferase